MIARRLARSAQEPPEWAREIQTELASHLNLATRVRLGVIDDVKLASTPWPQPGRSPTSSVTGGGCS